MQGNTKKLMENPGSIKLSQLTTLTVSQCSGDVFQSHLSSHLKTEIICYCHTSTQQALQVSVVDRGAVSTPNTPVWLAVYRQTAETGGIRKKAKFSPHHLVKAWNKPFALCSIYATMYVYSRGGPHTALAPRPSLIYCASPLINPLLIPHFEWSAGLYLWGRHRSHRVPW
jgi:hypothetical protein